MVGEAQTILKVLVGSRANGLYRPDSDYDYRAVFVEPTRKFHMLGLKKEEQPRTAHWIEGDVDDTAYELNHFMVLATRSNPSALNLLLAPVKEKTQEGEALLKLFPYIWDGSKAIEAYFGYGHNQTKKMVDNKDDRWEKFGVAHVRTLFYLDELLRWGRYTLVIPDGPVRNFCIDVRDRKVTRGEVLDYIEQTRFVIRRSYEKGHYRFAETKTDFVIVNDFISDTRRRFW